MTYPFTVVYEDNHLLIVNKPAGLLVQGDQTGDTPLVEWAKIYLKEKYDKQGNVFCGVVHRLDRPVSGLVVLAKTSKALERMNKTFQERAVEKIYWAIVQRRPTQPTGELIHWLVKNEAKNIVKAHNKEVKDSLKAILQYKFLKSVGTLAWLEVLPYTGRPHQIRVQLASMGCVICGDIKYGYPTPNPDGSINLHAARLNFIHPIKQEKISVQADLPNEITWNKIRPNS